MVDLNSDLDTQIERINALSRRTRVFISHIKEDEPMARKITQHLRKEEYRVFLFEDDLIPSQPFTKQVFKEIEGTVRDRGYVLVLLSRLSVLSSHVVKELQLVHGKNRTGIIPIVVDDLEKIRLAMPRSLEFILTGRLWLDFTQGEFLKNLNQLIELLQRTRVD